MLFVGLSELIDSGIFLKSHISFKLVASPILKNFAMIQLTFFF